MTAEETTVAAPRRGSVLTVVACVIGGLMLIGGAVGDWAISEGSVDLEIIELDTTEALAGYTFAPAALPLGLVVLALGAPLAGLSRGRATRPVAAAIALVGIGATAVVAIGLVGAAGEGDTIGSAAFAALVGGLVVAAGGVAGLRQRTGTRMSSRYDLEGGAGVGDDRVADEWRMASADEDLDDAVVDRDVEENG